MSDSELNKILDKVNGIYIPGSFDNIYNADRSLTDASKYIFRIFDYVRKYNQETGQNIPILGICFGLHAFVAYYCEIEKVKSKDCVDYFYIDRESLSLNPSSWLENNYDKSLFSLLPEDKFNNMKNKKIFYNWHLYSILLSSYNKSRMDKYFNLLTTSSGSAVKTSNKDAKNTDEFISALQHKTFPWYGLQFHPEKPMFEI